MALLLRRCGVVIVVDNLNRSVFINNDFKMYVWSVFINNDFKMYVFFKMLCAFDGTELFQRVKILRTN